MDATALLRPVPFALLAAALASTPALGAADVPVATPLPGRMPSPAAEGRVPVAGASLYYATFGAGEPVLLLHGGAGSSDHWAFQVPALALRRRVIVLDARGHGRSSRDGRPFGYHLLAEDVLAVLDALGIRRASIVGWSDGGIAGLDLAIHHPDRVSALVAFGANYDLTGLRRGGGSGPAFAAYLRRCEEDFRRLSPTPAAFDALLAALRPMWSTEPAFTAEQLGRIRARTLVLDGEHDELVRPEHTRALARAIPGAQLRFISGASHFAHWQRPEAFSDAVLQFLEEATPPGERR